MASTSPAAPEELSEIQAVCDLSPMQQAMLFEHQFRQEPGLYVLQTAVELRGKVDAERLRSSVAGIVNRHESLRSTFIWEDVTQPVRVVWTSMDVPFHILDWTGVGRDSLNREWDSHLQKGRQDGFDLEQGPLLRVDLVQVSADEAILLLTSHHLVVDGWSLMVVLRELFHLYRGTVEELPATPSQYTGYVRWLRERPNEDLFWAEWLADLRGPTSLRLSPRTSHAPTANECSLRLNELATEALFERARSLELTPASFIHGAWALLLRRYSGLDDVVFGTVVSGRSAESPFARGTVGPVIHTLPMRVMMRGDQTLRQWLEEVHERAFQLSQKSASLREIASAAGFQSPELFESVLIFENLGTAETFRSVSLDEVQIVGFRHAEQPTFPIELVVFPGPRLELKLRWREDALSEPVARRLLSNYRAALEGLARTDENASIREVEVLSERERHDVLRRWNATDEPFALEARLHELVAVHEVSDRVALVEDGTALTYSELCRQARAVAAGLVESGVSLEDRIVVWSSRSAEQLVIMLAALEVGAAVAFVDADVPDEVVARITQEGRARLLIASDAVVWADPSVPSTSLSALLASPRNHRSRSFRACGWNTAIFVPLLSEQLELRFVEWTHDWLVSLAGWSKQEFGFSAGEPYLCLGDAPSSLHALVGGLIAGAAAWIVPHREWSESGALPKVAVESGATKAFVSDSERWDASSNEGFPLAALELCVASGRSLLGLPRDVASAHTGGFAEAGGFNTVASLLSTGGSRWAFGRPISNVRCFVVDADFAPAPTGVSGELLISGVGIARGYDGSPAETAERFRPDPYASEPGSRLFSAGRRARWLPNGHVELSPRSRSSSRADRRRLESSRHHWLSRSALAAMGRRLGVEPSVEDCARSAILRRMTEQIALRPQRGDLPPHGGADDDGSSYWQRQLAGLPPLIDLPTDRTRAEPRSHQPRSIDVSLSDRDVDSVRALAAAMGVTPFIVLLAAWKVVLSKYSASVDVVVGVKPLQLQKHPPQTKRSTGNAALPLRTSLGGEPSFTEVVKRLNVVALEALAHDLVPLEPQPKRNDLGTWRDSFVQQLRFELRSASDPGSGSERAARQSAKPELGLMLVDEGQSVGGRLTYDQGLFESSTAKRLASYFERAISQLASEPLRLVSATSLLGEGELEQLQAWNRTGLDYPQTSCVWQLFEKVVEARPTAVAVVQGDRRLTYRELYEQACGVASALREAGLGPEARVGLYQRRTPELVASVLGCWMAGAAYVPLDPSYPAQRLRYMVEDSGARWVLSSAGAGAAEQLGDVRVLCVEDLVSRAGVAADASHPDQVAYLIYTSGSTGRPKGVEVPHRSVVSFLVSMASRPGLTASDNLLAVTTLSFDISVLELWLPLTVGARLTLATSEEASEPSDLQRLLTSEGVTAMQATPATWRMLLEAGWSGTGVKALCGGEALPRELAHELVGRGVQLWNMYGPTETTIWSSCARVAPQADRIRIGSPIGNTRMHVVDVGGLQRPTGAVGELFIGGVGVTRGYHERPRLTAERFVPDPFGVGERLYGTGDLARWHADGELECLGRVDQQIKLRGFRIELGEIEAVLEAQAGVKQAVAAIRGEGERKRLVAYVVGDANEESLLSALAQSLPGYMVPNAVSRIAKLPLTPAGKVDRRALPELELTSSNGGPPLTPLEHAVSEVWRDVLAVAQVGRQDDFFALGGHSLLATRLVSQLRARLGVELALRDVFEHPRLAQLAARVELANRSSMPVIERVPRGEPLAVSFAQERLWFLDKLTPNSAAYNIPAALRLVGTLREDALRSALSALVERHQPLRTRLSDRDGSLVQEVESSVELPLESEDLRGHADAEVEARRVAEAQMRLPFDLSKAPLWRVRLLRLSEAQHVLVFVMHHVISDGWSLAVLVDEVKELYAAYVEGREARLPELPVQYADYAAWQRRWLSGDELERQLSYWRDRLADAPPVLELPTDRPRPRVKGDRGGTVAVELPTELSVSVHARARDLGATPFMVLLAAWQLLLSKYARTDDVVVGTPIAGRRTSELEPLIGLFVNTLALRGDLSGAPTFRGLVERVKATTLDAYAHQDVPFEKLVAELGVDRNTAVTPIFQVMFVLQNAPPTALELPGLKLAMEPWENESAKFDLLFALAPAGDGFAGGLQYDAELFDRTSVERIATHWRRLLHQVLEDPEVTASGIQLMDEEERELVVSKFNATTRSYPAAFTVRDVFEHSVEAHPHETALEVGEERLSYRALDQRANSLACTLVSSGVAPGEVVGVCLDRGVDLYVSILAILKSNAAYLPLDVSYPPERLSAMVEDAEARRIVTTESYRERFEGRVIIQPAYGEEEADARPPHRSTSEMPAYVLFTSGSTGRPKGVFMPHRALTNLVGWQLERSPGARRTAQFAPVSFDVSFQEMFSTWGAGGTLIGLTEEERQDAGALLRLVEERRIERLFVPFVMLRQLVEAAQGALPTALVEVVTAGEQLVVSAELAQAFASGRVTLDNQYGPTEAHVVSAHRLSGEARDWQAMPPIGAPIGNARLYVWDEGGEPVPVGVPGELYIGGRCVSHGYAKRPRLTAERFVPGPLDGGRLYRTGDLCRWTVDGELSFLGRADQQVKIRGFRVEPGEVEAALGSLQGVTAAVAGVVRDAHRGATLVGYLVRAEGAELTDEALRAELREKLPEYMVPSAIVWMDALPRTPSGKVDRKALPEPEWQVAKYEPPQPGAEQTVAAIWQELLGVERVGRLDDFFALGGHSLLATRLQSQLRTRLGVELPLREMFQHPRLCDLAARASQAEHRAVVPRVERKRRRALVKHPLTGEVREIPMSKLEAALRRGFIEVVE